MLNLEKFDVFLIHKTLQFSKYTDFFECAQSRETKYYNSLNKVLSKKKGFGPLCTISFVSLLTGNFRAFHIQTSLISELQSLVVTTSVHERCWIFAHLARISFGVAETVRTTEWTLYQFAIFSKHGK